jgi:hypothetical protein
MVNATLLNFAYPDGNGGDYPDAAYVLRVRAPLLPQLNFSPDLNTNGQSNVASGILADNQRALYQVSVPEKVNGATVLGWRLNLGASNGVPYLRIRRGPLLPDDSGSPDISPFVTPAANFVPPYLTPGTWYVEVKGSGLTEFSLTSSALTTNTLSHVVWRMPAQGQGELTPGLSLPVIGDSGVDASGNPILDPQTGTVTDQGVDLKQGNFDYYAVVVPTNNAGLLRTELQAISGNPQLYVRAGDAPTISHLSSGSTGYGLYDRQLTASATQYGNWVPLNGRYESQLTPGLWVLAVQAAGNGNARYRLRLSCGNPTGNGLVQDLPLDGGNLADQKINGGDWRYYRVQIPSNAPANWNLAFNRSLGSARMFIRDSVPPGDGNLVGDFSDPNYNPGTPPQYAWPGPYYYSRFDLQTWSTDGKNHGSYPRFDAPGTYNLTTPPLRPGSVYYVGFWSPNDTTFSISSSTSGGPVVVTNDLPFFGGSISQTLPSHGSLRYRIPVPAGATRLSFNANGSAELQFVLEQGTLPLTGGPAHWIGNGTNIVFDQTLFPSAPWPWLASYSYYLTITNTSLTAENFTLTLANPSDLAVLNLLAPSFVTLVDPYPAVNVAWGVTNRGPGFASGVWYDRVWYSTNGLLDGQSMDLGEFAINLNLAPGETYWQTNSLTLPIAEPGTYALFVQADAYDSLYDLRTDNNLFGPVFGKVDLPPSFTAVSVSGNNFVLSWTSVPGQKYQLQYKTDLNQPIWLDLGNTITANASNITFLDPLTHSNRFYRLELAP